MTVISSVRFYKDQEVRAFWDEEHSKWWFSAIDIVGILSESDRPRKYWSDLKSKLKSEESELSAKIGRLKMMAPDGKFRLTDVLDGDGIILLAKIFPNHKGSDFLDWFLYSENSIGGQSRKKAYALFEHNLVQEEDIGTTKALQQIHAYLF